MLMCFRRENTLLFPLINRRLLYSQLFINFQCYLRNCFSWPHFAQFSNEVTELNDLRSLWDLVFCECLTHNRHICWINECVTLIYHQMPQFFIFERSHGSAFSSFCHYPSWSQIWIVTVVSEVRFLPPVSRFSKPFCTHQCDSTTLMI